MALSRSALSDTLIKLEQYFQWTNDNIFNKQLTDLEKKTGYAGLGVGASSLVASYLLAADFGAYLGNKMGASNALSQLLRFVFGISAYIPTSTLYSLPMQTEFIGFAKRYEGKIALPRRQDKIYWRNKSCYPALFFAAFAGLPFFSLLKGYLDKIPVLNYYLPTQILVMLSLVCYRTEMQLIEKTFNHYSAEEEIIKYSRQSLHRKIQSRLHNLKFLSDEDIVELYHLLKEEYGDLDTLIKLKFLLFSFADVNHGEAAKERATVSMLAKYRKAFSDVLCYIIGVTACIIFFALSVKSVCTILGFENTEASSSIIKFAEVCAVLSLLPNMIFGAITTQLKSERIHNAIEEREYCPSLKAFSAQVLATFSAIPNTFLAIQAASTVAKILLIIPTCLGPMFARSVSFETLLEQGMGAYDDRYHHDEPRVMRNKLIAMLKKIEATIDLLDGQSVVALDQVMTSPFEQSFHLSQQHGISLVPDQQGKEWKIVPSTDTPVSEVKIDIPTETTTNPATGFPVSQSRDTLFSSTIERDAELHSSAATRQSFPLGDQHISSLTSEKRIK